MVDKFTQEQRSQIMAIVHSSSTLPEIKARKLLVCLDEFLSRK